MFALTTLFTPRTAPKTFINKLVLLLRIKRRRFHIGLFLVGAEAHDCAAADDLLTPKRRRNQFFNKVVVALNQAASIPFLPGAGDIYVCADYFFYPKNGAVIIYCCYFESNGAVSIFFKNNVDAFPIIRRRKHRVLPFNRRQTNNCRMYNT